MSASFAYRKVCRTTRSCSCSASVSCIHTSVRMRDTEPHRSSWSTSRAGVVSKTTVESETKRHTVVAVEDSAVGIQDLRKLSVGSMDCDLVGAGGRFEQDRGEGRLRGCGELPKSTIRTGAFATGLLEESTDRALAQENVEKVVHRRRELTGFLVRIRQQHGDFGANLLPV